MKIFEMQEAWVLEEVAVGECFMIGKDLYIKTNLRDLSDATCECVRLIDGCSKWLKSDAVVMPMDAEIRVKGFYCQEDGEDE